MSLVSELMFRSRPVIEHCISLPCQFTTLLTFYSRQNLTRSIAVCAMQHCMHAASLGTVSVTDIDAIHTMAGSVVVGVSAMHACTSYAFWHCFGWFKSALLLQQCQWHKHHSSACSCDKQTCTLSNSVLRGQCLFGAASWDESIRFWHRKGHPHTVARTAAYAADNSPAQSLEVSQATSPCQVCRVMLHDVRSAFESAAHLIHD